jgi:VWFA-related protein
MFPSTRNAIFIFCALQTANPQTPPPFHSNVELVVVSCSVVDAKGVPVTDLTRDDFQVYDNDARRPLQNFWIDTDSPLTLGVIIDASESQKDQLPEHRQTALDLLQKILRHGDRAFVVSVEEDVRLWADLTDQVEDIRSRLARSARDPFGEPCPKHQGNFPGMRPWSACGPTPLWNAIYDAAHLKLQPVTGNKALLLLTDGFDTGSTHTWNQAAEAVNRADASLYVIQYKTASGRSFAPDLSNLIAETGGTRFHAPEGDYQQIISRLETDFRHRYVLGFHPEKLSARRRHEVRIEVSRPDLTVRARKTYFQDPPAFGR